MKPLKWSLFLVVVFTYCAIEQHAYQRRHLTEFWLETHPEMRGAIEQGCVYIEPYRWWQFFGWPGADQRIKDGWDALTDFKTSWCAKAKGSE